MSTTRLLILGVVRIFEPVHGYFVRRELLSWRADQWASVNPGSIYNALRTLTRDGFLVEEEGLETDGSRTKTMYRLTSDGHAEFEDLLRDAFWSLNEYTPDRMYAAVGFMTFLTRAEVTAALEHRVAQIEALKLALAYKEGAMLRQPSTPDHTAEILELAVARLDGELGWTRQLLERMRGGAYVFEGEGERHAPALD
jgi:DNA-binding PadR family transcriptional regulator